MRLSFLLFLLNLFIGFSTFFPNTIKAQVNLSPLVYKFSVGGITDRVAAKQVQYELVQEYFITDCKFIDESDVFKLYTTEFITFSALQQLLLTSGYQLSEKVILSDGRILMNPKITNTTQTE